MSCVLTLNMGTESSKVGVFNNNVCVAKKTINHAREDLLKNPTTKEQVVFRTEVVRTWLKEINVDMKDVDAISIRIAALPHEIPGGTYRVEGQLEKDIYTLINPDEHMPHGARLVLPMAKNLSEGYDIPIFLVDPANINEMIPEAKLSGLPQLPRTTVFHALNQKMCARLQAEKLGRKYTECNFVVAHMGGGTSVSAHRKGLVIDTNHCGGDDGAFSPTRTGTLPARKLISYIFDNQLTKEQALELTKGKGGIYAYLGTSDMIEAEKRAADGDELADLVVRAYAYRVAKEIGAYVAVLAGDVNGIILTGGIAHSKVVTNIVIQHVESFAPVSIYPGEMEGEALAAGAERVLSGEEDAAVYI